LEGNTFSIVNLEYSMETQSNRTDINSLAYALEAPAANAIDYTLNSFSKEDMINAFDKIIEVKNFFQRSSLAKLADLLNGLSSLKGKKNFLVFKNNKYINVPTENIAFFYIKYESPVIMCFDQQEYFVDYSLDRVQELLPETHFFRLNRQYLINFNAIREVEHYFARKLLVKSVVPIKDKLVISREKVSEFLNWLDNR
jgi:two-component system, LytTR family, response regulator